MGAFALAYPYRAFLGGRIADGDDEVEILPAKFIHPLGTALMGNANFL